MIVLVEPQGARNIGSICRVMLNFGFHELRLVAPRADHLSQEARYMAVKDSRQLLKKAKLFKKLADAVADCHIVWGSSRRFGKYRRDWHLPRDINRANDSLAPEQRMALVFGREDHGLSNSELDLCTSFLSIPTSAAFPSMNLAQAVGVCLYEIQRTATVSNAPQPRQRAKNEEIEAMIQHMRHALLECGYLDPQNPDHILRAYRRIFSRAGLEGREVRILHGLWRRIEWLTGQTKKPLR